MIDVDEDEDPTRICTKCKLKPRWSRHGTCRRCVDCAGRTVARCIRLRKNDSFAGRADRATLARERYGLLKAAGASPKFAKDHCRSTGVYLLAMKDLKCP
jgi:hypothetical protein